MAVKGWVTDAIFMDDTALFCSGHMRDGTKAWLKGYTFVDSTVDPSVLTNLDMAEILDPTSTKYRDYIPYVYDDANYKWCNPSWEEAVLNEE